MARFGGFCRLNATSEPEAAVLNAAPGSSAHPLLFSRCFFVEVFLEPGEEAADFFRLAEIDDGVVNRILVLKAEQRRQLFLVEFVDAFGDVMGEREIEKGFLLCSERAIGSAPKLLWQSRLTLFQLSLLEIPVAVAINAAVWWPAGN